MFFIKKGSAFTNKMHYLCQHSEPPAKLVVCFTPIVIDRTLPAYNCTTAKDSTFCLNKFFHAY